MTVRHREERGMPDGMRKWNFEDFMIGRKLDFDIKVKHFVLKYRRSYENFTCYNWITEGCGYECILR